jgi:hypothetical protein
MMPAAPAMQVQVKVPATPETSIRGWVTSGEVNCLRKHCGDESAEYSAAVFGRREFGEPQVQVGHCQAHADAAHEQAGHDQGGRACRADDEPARAEQRHTGGADLRAAESPALPDLGARHVGAAGPWASSRLFLIMAGQVLSRGCIEARTGGASLASVTIT